MALADPLASAIRRVTLQQEQWDRQGEVGQRLAVLMPAFPHRQFVVALAHVAEVISGTMICHVSLAHSHNGRTVPRAGLATTLLLHT